MRGEKRKGSCIRGFENGFRKTCAYWCFLFPVALPPAYLREREGVPEGLEELLERTGKKKRRETYMRWRRFEKNDKEKWRLCPSVETRHKQKKAYRPHLPSPRNLLSG